MHPIGMSAGGTSSASGVADCTDTVTLNNAAIFTVLPYPIDQAGSAAGSLRENSYDQEVQTCRRHCSVVYLTRCFWFFSCRRGQVLLIRFRTLSSASKVNTYEILMKCELTRPQPMALPRSALTLVSTPSDIILADQSTFGFSVRSFSIE